MAPKILGFDFENFGQRFLENGLVFFLGTFFEHIYGSKDSDYLKIFYFLVRGHETKQFGHIAHDLCPRMVYYLRQKLRQLFSFR